ncbi:MAG: hypothetical protein JNJ47_02435 [Alphaproteobacteria bacterium]|nr:hypothetical protein [Alphaproteobacteria bacterium]
MSETTLSVIAVKGKLEKLERLLSFVRTKDSDGTRRIDLRNLLPFKLQTESPVEQEEFEKTKKHLASFENEEIEVEISENVVSFTAFSTRSIRSVVPYFMSIEFPELEFFWSRSVAIHGEIESMVFRHGKLSGHLGSTSQSELGGFYVCKLRNELQPLVDKKDNFKTYSKLSIPLSFRESNSSRSQEIEAWKMSPEDILGFDSALKTPFSVTVLVIAEKVHSEEFLSFCNLFRSINMGEPNLDAIVKISKVPGENESELSERIWGMDVHDPVRFESLTIVGQLGIQMTTSLCSGNGYAIWKRAWEMFPNLTFHVNYSQIYNFQNEVYFQVKGGVLIGFESVAMCKSRARNLIVTSLKNCDSLLTVRNVDGAYIEVVIQVGKNLRDLIRASALETQGDSVKKEIFRTQTVAGSESLDDIFED